MCVTRLMSASRKHTVERRSAAPIRISTYIRYRVLRSASRGAVRSVDRDCAGRNAKSVKEVEPRQSLRYVVAELLWKREGSTWQKPGTTGVQDLGMYRRLTSKRERAARGWVETQSPRPLDVRQGVNAESAAILLAAVRCLRSSDEVGESRWSEGRHGE